MPEKSHWPFGESGISGEDDSRREFEREREKAKLAEQQEAAKHRVRSNRLLVGGRAHTRKPGLS
jgi:hypothetical protein